MAWTAKPSPGASLNTGDALYSSCKAYCPMLDGSGVVKEVLNALSMTGSGPTWTDPGTNPPGYRVATSSSADDKFADTFDPIGGLSAFSSVTWIRSGTWSTINANAINGFGRWSAGGSYFMNRFTSATEWRVIVDLSTTDVDVTANPSLSDDTDYTMIWVYSGGTLTLYRNTTSINSGSGGVGTLNTIQSTYGLSAVHGVNSHSPFTVTNGGIYGCALFNKALDADERTRMVNEGPAFLYAAASTVGALNASIGEPMIGGATF